MTFFLFFEKFLAKEIKTRDMFDDGKVKTMRFTWIIKKIKPKLKSTPKFFEKSTFRNSRTISRCWVPFLGLYELSKPNS